MIWKLFPDGDEVNDRLYFNHLPTIENYYGESISINGFDLQKAVIKAFSSLRKVFKVWNAFKVRVIFQTLQRKKSTPKSSRTIKLISDFSCSKNDFLKLPHLSWQLKPEFKKENINFEIYTNDSLTVS